MRKRLLWRNLSLKSTPKPGQPFAICLHSTYVSLAWTPAVGTDNFKVVGYELTYRRVNDVKWSLVSTKDALLTVAVNGRIKHHNIFTRT